MSKAKKAVYAAKQKAAADTAGTASLSLSPQGAPMPKTPKKVITRKQSRGK
jgi:hypothetical protein